MKRALAVLLAAVMALCFMTGCDHKDDKSGPGSAYSADNGVVVIPTSSYSSSASVTAAPEAPVTPEPADTETAQTQAATQSPYSREPSGTEAPAATAVPTSAPTAAPTPSPTPVPTPVPTPTEEPIEPLNYITGHVNSNGVNLREEPNTNSTILGAYSTGHNLLITGRNSEWYRVQIDGLTGFMARRFVSLGYSATPTPTAKPTATPTPKPTATPTNAPTPSPVPEYYTVTPGQFTDYEIRLVAALVYKEAQYSTSLGMRAIASVVLNRVLNETTNFPNDVRGVLFQPGQFGYSEETLVNTNFSQLALESAQYVFRDHGSTMPKKVLFFRAAYLGIYWTSYTQYYTTIEYVNYYYGIIYF